MYNEFPPKMMTPEVIKSHIAQYRCYIKWSNRPEEIERYKKHIAELKSMLKQMQGKAA
jgi:hypothetical protein